MLREKIISLFKECEPEVQEILAEVLAKEWEKLSLDKPKGIKEDIRAIIDDKARSLDDEA